MYKPIFCEKFPTIKEKLLLYRCFSCFQPCCYTQYFFLFLQLLIGDTVDAFVYQNLWYRLSSTLFYPTYYKTFSCFTALYKYIMLFPYIIIKILKGYMMKACASHYLAECCNFFIGVKYFTVCLQKQ